MRVLVSSTPGYGHVLPMLGLARTLQRRGHDVLWATAADSCPLVRAAGVPATAAGLTDAEAAGLRLAARRSVSGMPPELAPLFLFRRIFGRDRVEPMLAALLPAATDWRPDLVLHEQGELAAPLVATLLEVPHVNHSFGGPIPSVALAGAGEDVADLWLDRGLGVPPYAGSFEYLYLDICTPALRTVPLDHIPAVQAARPVTYDGEQAPELGALLAGDDPRPLVYLTLGTVRNQVDLLSRVTAAMSTLDARVLVTVGHDVDPMELGAQRSGVTVRRWVPQAAVLPHSSVVVSHGGSGTVLAAAAEGLPQVCLPQGADQFRNADGVVRAGAGLALHPDAASPGAIVAAARAALLDAGLRAGAARVREEILAMPSPDEVVDRLEQVSREPTRPRRLA